MALNLGELFFQLGADTRGLKKAEKQAKKFAKNTDKQFKKVKKSSKGLNEQFKGMTSAISGLVLVAGATKIAYEWLKVNREFQTLNSSLVTVTGSSEKAEEAFEWIEKFATNTPYQLSEVVRGFTKLTALGLEPSAKALESYGNVASGMGKSLDQFIEAVADASVAEFERLKEFGIKSRNQGDTIKFTFRGVATTVKNSAQDITNYLQELGNVEFSGGMARQMETLDGKISNLSDAWDKFMRSLDDKGVVSSAITTLTQALSELAGDEGAKISAQIRSLTGEFESLQASLALDKATNFFGWRDGQIEKATNKIASLNTQLTMLEFKRRSWGEESSDSRAIGNVETEISNAFARSSILEKQEGESLASIFKNNEKIKTQFLMTQQEVRLQNLTKSYKNQRDIAKKAHLLGSEEFLELERNFHKAKTIIQGEEAIKKIQALEESLLTEREIEIRHYEEALEQLIISEELKIETTIPYYELKERLQQEHYSRLAGMNKQFHKETNIINTIAASAGLNLDKKVDGQTLRNQGEIFSKTIDAAAEHSKEFFAIKKALALATALIEAPKAILSSFTFGTEIGGPIVGGIFAGIAAAATAVQIAAIASSSYSGKAVGGNVFGGGMYKVNEQGPEMLSVGGSDFLMMGSQGGSITPNNKLNSGGSKVIVNIYPQSDETAKVQSSETNEGTQIDVVIEQIEQKIADGIGQGGSPVSQSIESQYGLNRSAGAVT